MLQKLSLLTTPFAVVIFIIKIVIALNKCGKKTNFKISKFCDLQLIVMWLF